MLTGHNLLDATLSPISRLLLPERWHFVGRRLWSQNETHGETCVYKPHARTGHQGEALVINEVVHKVNGLILWSITPSSSSHVLIWVHLITGQPQGHRAGPAPSHKQTLARTRSVLSTFALSVHSLYSSSSTDRGRYLWLLQWCWVWNVSSLDASGCILPLLTQPQRQGLPGKRSRDSPTGMGSFFTLLCCSPLLIYQKNWTDQSNKERKQFWTPDTMKYL